MQKSNPQRYDLHSQLTWHRKDTVLDLIISLTWEDYQKWLVSYVGSSIRVDWLSQELSCSNKFEHQDYCEESKKQRNEVKLNTPLWSRDHAQDPFSLAEIREKKSISYCCISLLIEIIVPQFPPFFESNGSLWEWRKKPCIALTIVTHKNASFFLTAHHHFTNKAKFKA